MNFVATVKNIRGVAERICRHYNIGVIFNLKKKKIAISSLKIAFYN